MCQYRLLRIKLMLGLATAVVIVAGCTHKIEVAPPEKPITINMNVKIDHEVRIKVDRELDNIISEDSELF